jgi:hypothetical protein
MSGDVPDEIKCLGIEASPSFVRRTRGHVRLANLEGKLALGAGGQKQSRNCAPSSAHSPGAPMKLGSSRGMDKKRPRGSERSKPCHELAIDPTFAATLTLGGMTKRSPVSGALQALF